MYITTPFTNTYPPTAGMMLLATIGVGDNMKALGVMMAMWLYVWGRKQTWEWGLTREHRFVQQRMLCMPNERDILEGNFWRWMNDLEI